jgi:hypothetical protein
MDVQPAIAAVTINIKTGKSKRLGGQLKKRLTQ